jgi:hypothetical protein
MIHPYLSVQFVFTIELAHNIDRASIIALCSHAGDGNTALSGILIGSLAGIGSLGLVVVTISTCAIIMILIFKWKSQLRYYLVLYTQSALHSRSPNRFSLNTGHRDQDNQVYLYLYVQVYVKIIDEC